MDIYNVLIEAFNNGNYDLLANLLIGFTFLWLYNQFRKSYDITKSENKLDLENALESYSNLYHIIIAFELDEINLDKLFNNINKTMAFLPKNLTEEILELDFRDLGNNSSSLQDIKYKIKNEINLLKSKQCTIATFNPNEDIFVQISWFLSRNNFDSFIMPFIYAIFAFVGFLYILLFSQLAIELSGFNRVNLVFVFLNLMLVLMTSAYIMDSFLKRELRREALCYFLTLIFIPWILCTFIIGIKSSLINSFTILIFLFQANKKKFLQPRNIPA